MRPTTSPLVRAALLAVLALVATSPGCGGGGGSGGGDPCQPPGSLAALALEGATAPDTGGGDYGFFVSQTKIHVAAGGWTVFVADVVDAGSTQALFVAPPTSPVRLVFRQGESVPSPGDGTIASFTRVFVTPQGVVVALVAIAGGTDTFGILTARVDGAGNVAEKDGAIYSGDTLPAAPGLVSPGALTSIPAAHLAVSDPGVTFFVGFGSTGSGVYRVDRSGSPLVAVAQDGQVAPGFAAGRFLGTNWQAVGVDEDGVLAGFAVDVVPFGEEGVFAHNLSLTTLVAKTGDSPPSTGSRDLADPYDSGPLVVALQSGVGVFVWEGELEGADPNDVVLLRTMSPTEGPLQTMVAGGQSAPGGGGSATVGEIRVLDAEVDAFAVTVRAEILGGTTTEIFWNLPSAGTFVEIWRQGDNAPGGGAAQFTTVYPSLDVPSTVDADVGGSPAVSAVLSDASTAVFWALRSCGFFDIARQGGSVPGVGGGSFATFAVPTTVTTASGVIAFRAQIDGAPGTASGIFRRR
jgi:hypothetical protein